MRRQRARDGVVLVGHRHRPELFALLARARLMSAPIRFGAVRILASASTMRRR